LNALLIAGRQDWRVRTKLASRRANVTTRHRVLAAVLFFASTVFGSAGFGHADDRTIPPTTAANQNWVVSLGGKVKHPQQLDLNALQRLPAEQVTVSYQAGHGVEEASFTGVPLWTLLGEAGGIDDPANRAELRHVIRITARDGYVVVLSTGEIAPILAPNRRFSRIDETMRRRPRRVFVW
jgi:DMSO/TMAO reductase YedYZ molybdopterin-dependent catalytic subunit